MIEGIETFYQEIGEAIDASIPEPWSSGKVEVIFYPGAIHFLGEYQSEKEGVDRGFSINLEGERAFRGLRKLFKASGKPVWGSVIFELNADGKFNVIWGYDDCDENGDALFDEDEFIARNEERHRRLAQALGD